MQRRRDRSPLEKEVTAVAAALHEHWNPIGVRDLPVDEYDAYAPGVVSLLHAKVDDQTVARHLALLEERRFSLRPQPLEHLVTVAARLRTAATRSRGT